MKEYSVNVRMKTKDHGVDAASLPPWITIQDWPCIRSGVRMWMTEKDAILKIQGVYATYHIRKKEERKTLFQ